MLVKILSFIASVLSSTRYKAVLIPCIVLALAVTGLTMVAIFHESGSRTAASTTSETDDAADNDRQSASPQISGMGTQTPKDDSSQVVAQKPNDTKPSNENPAGNTASQPEHPAPAAFDFTLNKDTLTLSRDSTSDMFVATASDAADVTWTVTPETNDGNSIEVVNDKNKRTAPVFSFQLRATARATPGQYRLTVTAQDPARTINLSKIIALTIAP